MADAALAGLAKMAPMLGALGGALTLGAHSGLKQKKASKKKSSSGSKKSSKSSSKNAVVTSQKDFTGTSTKTKKRSRSSVKASKVKAKKTKAFKKKVKKALSAPRHFTNFVTTIGRSYISGTNGTTNLLIPIYGWRGTGTNSGSDAIGAATPGTSSPAFRSDQISLMSQYFINSRLYPSAAGANTAVNQWWFKHTSTTLDLTIANTGVSNEVSSTVDRAVAIEYELYLIKAGRSSPKDPAAGATNNIQDLVNLADANSQIFGAASSGTFGNYATASDPAWTPSTVAFSKSYMRSKYLGRGYIESGGRAVRYKITQTRGKKGFYNKKIFDSLDTGALDTNHGMYPGHACAILISFRGIPKTPTVAYPQARMTVLANYDHKTYADGQTQPGKDTVVLHGNQIA